MNGGRRAAIASIVIAINSQSSVKTIYSYELSRHISMSGNINNKVISAYDHERNCYITGNASSTNNFSLYDYGVSAYIDLKIDGEKFSGYDYSSGSHFSGTIRSKTVSFYDHQTSTYYDFSA